MAESTVVYTPESNGGSVPAWLAMNNGGFGNGLGGWGGGILGFFLGLLFGNGWGGFGNGFGGFGGGNAGAGFLSNQINNDSGRELLMNAITSQGEASRAAIQNLATSLGQDFTLVNSAVQTLQGGLTSLALQQAVSVPQIINSIQSGNADLASQLCKCCCDQRLLTTQQGYESQLRTLEQTNLLGSQADRNANAITGAISAQTVTINDQFCKLQNREYESRIEALKTELANANRAADKSEILSSVSSMLAPIAGQVASIKAAMPPTVAVQYPQIQAIPSFNTIELLANVGILERLINGGSSTTTGGTTTASV